MEKFKFLLDSADGRREEILAVSLESAKKIAMKQGYPCSIVLSAPWGGRYERKRIDLANGNWKIEKTWRMIG